MAVTEPGRPRRRGGTLDGDDRRFPPKGFDPQQASPETLDYYRLPRQPDPGTQPTLRKAWRRMFKPPLDWVHPDLERYDAVLSRVPQLRQFPVSATRIEHSQNWCGASIVPHDGRRFVQVFGEWKPPTPSLPPPYGRGPPNQDNVYQTSTWIGLDGDRRYVNSSLPQVGTAQNLTVAANGAESRKYFAWFQWWARDQLQVTFKKINGVKVQPGKSVMGLVWAWDSTHAVILFRNFAPLNQITVLFKQSPAIQPVTAIPVRPVISGATAQWIMERPALLHLGATALDLFPAYTATTFDRCVAGAASAPGFPDSEEVLEAPRFKRMFEAVRDEPARTRFISMPKRISDTSFTTRYGGF